MVYPLEKHILKQLFGDIVNLKMSVPIDLPVFLSIQDYIFEYVNNYTDLKQFMIINKLDKVKWNQIQEINIEQI